MIKAYIIRMLGMIFFSFAFLAIIFSLNSTGVLLVDASMYLILFPSFCMGVLTYALFPGDIVIVDTAKIRIKYIVFFMSVMGALILNILPSYMEYNSIQIVISMALMGLGMGYLFLHWWMNIFLVIPHKRLEGPSYLICPIIVFVSIWLYQPPSILNLLQIDQSQNFYQFGFLFAFLMLIMLILEPISDPISISTVYNLDKLKKKMLLLGLLSIEYMLILSLVICWIFIHLRYMLFDHFKHLELLYSLYFLVVFLLIKPFVKDKWSYFSIQAFILLCVCFLVLFFNATILGQKNHNLIDFVFEILTGFSALLIATYFQMLADAFRNPGLHVFIPIAIGMCLFFISVAIVLMPVLTSVSIDFILDVMGVLSVSVFFMTSLSILLYWICLKEE